LVVVAVGIAAVAAPAAAVHSEEHHGLCAAGNSSGTVEHGHRACVQLEEDDPYELKDPNEAREAVNVTVEFEGPGEETVEAAWGAVQSLVHGGDLDPLFELLGDVIGHGVPTRPEPPTPSPTPPGAGEATVITCPEAGWTGVLTEVEGYETGVCIKSDLWTGGSGPTPGADVDTCSAGGVIVTESASHTRAGACWKVRAGVGTNPSENPEVALDECELADAGGQDPRVQSGDIGVAFCAGAVVDPGRPPYDVGIEPCPERGVDPYIIVAGYGAGICVDVVLLD
jgi:hypothetical protein